MNKGSQAHYPSSPAHESDMQGEIWQGFHDRYPPRHTWRDGWHVVLFVEHMEVRRGVIASEHFEKLRSIKKVRTRFFRGGKLP